MVDTHIPPDKHTLLDVVQKIGWTTVIKSLFHSDTYNKISRDDGVEVMVRATPPSLSNSEINMIALICKRTKKLIAKYIKNSMSRYRRVEFPFHKPFFNEWRNEAYARFKDIFRSDAFEYRVTTPFHQSGCERSPMLIWKEDTLLGKIQAFEYMHAWMIVKIHVVDNETSRYVPVDSFMFAATNEYLHVYLAVKDNVAHHAKRLELRSFKAYVVSRVVEAMQTEAVAASHA
jgi:hypothetical protein